MASDDHDWEDCPHTFAPVDRESVDLEKQNHFFHDTNGGCPGECLADHNHPNVIFAQ